MRIDMASFNLNLGWIWYMDRCIIRSQGVAMLDIIKLWDDQRTGTTRLEIITKGGLGLLGSVHRFISQCKPHGLDEV